MTATRVWHTKHFTGKLEDEEQLCITFVTYSLEILHCDLSFTNERVYQERREREISSKLDLRALSFSSFYQLTLDL